jgi:hypothetical protein
MNQKFLNWLGNTIRQEDFIGPWIDVRKSELLPFFSNTITNVLNGVTIIVITDSDREWFLKYIMTTVNHKYQNRPMLPFVDLQSLVPDINKVDTDMDIEYIIDYLDICFPNDYQFFYIGKAQDKRIKITRSKEDNFLIAFDDELPQSFYLHSLDESLDIKLMQLFKLFNMTISETLFGNIDVSL